MELTTIKGFELSKELSKKLADLGFAKTFTEEDLILS